MLRGGPRHPWWVQGLEERTEHIETESADGATLEGAVSAGLALNSSTVFTGLEKPLCPVGKEGRHHPVHPGCSPGPSDGSGGIFFSPTR